ncbi:phage tail protein [Pseudomonas shahriarae]|uniref:Phage tail protein n=1 Tax=Pseudomonas shahriarae TaxID=2745512 RepID=A0ABT5NBA3_9PSED|nr:phage tail protein [Pseudomonas shahriarae]MDD0985816.1 phage tail protein [Pseudomonas shahriarae]MDD1032754.1 phage tail protein [Pseudomonas shahriarae]
MGAAAQIDVQGEKGGSSKPKSPTEASDSLRSTNLAKLLIAVGEGEFDGVPTDYDIYLDNTPIRDASGNYNFPNVKWDWRPGSVDQTYIPGIPAVENETSLNVELRSDSPWVRSITNIQLSAVRLRFAWPALQRQDDQGNVVGYRIDYAIDVATDGGPYQQVYPDAVDGKTTTRYERSRRVDLPTATTGWLIRVRRLTPNQNSNRIADTMLIAGITEVIDAKLRYPNTALLYIEFDAEQFTNIPAVTVECNARRWMVPSNYDPIQRTYSGAWDGTMKSAWTNNPAWITFGVCTEDRFGLGKRIKSFMVDKWELFRIAQYCDQLVPNGLGGTEPRFLCDMNLQGKADAWSLLRDISAIYRGMTYWAQGQLVMQADMPRAQDFDYVFTRSNVIDGKFSYGSASAKTRYTRALVSYDNPANNYDTDVIPFADPDLQRRYGDRPTELSAIGCTRASEAQRRGKWAILSNNQDRTVSFKTGMEGVIPLPGHIIPVADSLLAGREIGGRIAAASGRVVTLDRNTQAKAGDRLIINLPGGRAEGRTVQSVSDRDVTVTIAYSEPPVPQLQWALDADDLAIPLYRVLRTKRTLEGDFEISALQFEPSKFAHIDTGARLEERPISVTPITVVPAPASVSVAAASSVAQGLAVATMTISWPAVDGAVGYDVEWRKDSGNWIKLLRTGLTNADVVGIYAGDYIARVRAVSAFDITSQWRNSILTNLKGKEGVPPAVAFLTTTSLVYGIGIQWGFPPGAEDTQRTEVWYSESADLETAKKLSDFSYPQATHEMHSLLAGASLFFWARLVDRTGNVGPFFPIPGAVNGQASSDQSEYEKYFADKIGKGALYPSLREEIALISGDGDGSVNERLKEAKAELEGLLGQITGAEPYDPAKPYGAGAFTQKDGHLYQATGPVPAGEAPPNPLYWKDIGTILQTTDALAQQVQLVSSMIEEIDGKVVATASSVEALRSAAREDDGAGDLAGVIKGWQSTADLALEKRTRATENEAMAQQYLTMSAQVGANKSGLTVLEQVVATNRETAATQVNQLKSDLALTDEKVAGNAVAITGLDTKVTEVDGKVTSLAASNESLRAAVRGDDGAADLAGVVKSWESTASFSAEKRVQATANEALAKTTETLQSSIGQTNASVQQVSQTVVNLDGKVSAQTTIKAQTIANGKKVMAGLALGSDGETSEILAFAQRFAIVDEVSGQLITPFVVSGGQVFINQAVINKAFIQEIILGMTLRSEAVDSKGRPLLEINVKAGTFVLRGEGTGGSSMLNNDGLAVYDGNEVRRVLVGRLS